MSRSVPEDRRVRFQVAVLLVRLSLARDRNDPDAVAGAAQRLLALAASPQAIEAGVGEEGLRATALLDLAAAEMWSGQLEAAERHVEQGLKDARRIGWPMLELQALSYRAFVGMVRSPAIGEQRARGAIEVARAHGWEDTAWAAGSAYVALGNVTLWRGQLAEAEGWLDRAELVVRGFAEPTTAMTEPTTAMMLYVDRAMLEFVCGRHEAAMTAHGAVESIQQGFARQHGLATRAQALKLGMLVRVGETELVQRALDDMDEDVRAGSAMRVVQAALRLARDDPEGAAAALAPIFDGASLIDSPRWNIQALLLKARVEDALGDAGASSRALERALELAEPDGLLLPFLLDPAQDLLERHARLRTTHASLISEILNLQSGHPPTARPEHAEPLREPLSESELRVLRYLPTNLPAPEIAGELFVSLNTIRTHMRRVYSKLGVHSRGDAVRRGRELGLLSPSSPRR